MKSEWLSKNFIFTFIILGSLCRMEDYCLTENRFDARHSDHLNNRGLREAFKDSNDKLGNGSYGVVKRINWTENGKTSTVAVKQIIIRHGQLIPIVEKEMRTMKDLQNVEGIIQMKDCLTMEENFPSGTPVGNQVVYGSFRAPVVYAVLEKLYETFSPRPMLGNRSPLAKMKNGKPLDKLRVYLKIAKAIETLHSKDYVHSDLKPDNFMADNEDLQTIKLIDLGFTAKKGSPYEGSSPLFSPYEGLTRERLYPSFDIYGFAIGVAAIEYSTDELEALVLGHFLSRQLKQFVNTLANFVKTKVARVKGFGAISASGDNFSKILSDCTEFEPTSRPTASQLVKRITKYIATLEAAGYDKDPATAEKALKSVMGAAGNAGQENQNVGGLLQTSRAVISNGFDSVRRVSFMSENPYKDLAIRAIVIGAVVGVLLLIEYLVRKPRATVGNLAAEA